MSVEESHRPADDDQQRQHIADLGDHVTQPFQLFIQRGLHAVVYLSRLKHLAVLRLVAHGEHPSDAVALHHLGAPHHVVRRECRLLVRVRRLHRLVTYRLACQRGLVHVQRHRLQQLDVCWNLLARLYEHQVTHHHVLALDGRGMAVTDHLHLLFVVHLVEQVELTVRFQFEDECDACCQDDGHEDADGFEEHSHAFVALQSHPSVVFRA